MGETVRIALVGCGGMGTRHALGYAALERANSSPARLVAVCDPNLGRAAALAERFASLCGRSPRVLPDLRSALEWAEVDAVDLVIPTRLHHEAAIQALRAGRHLLVEKPFALTLRACRAVAEAARESGLTLAVAENFRRVPTNRALHALITGGVIGRPYAVSVQVVRQSSGPPSGEWYRDRRLVGSLPNLELAVHEADLLRHLLGEVAEVRAVTGAFEGGADDIGLSILRFVSGALGQLMVLTSGHGGEADSRIVVGSRGRVASRRWEGWEDGSVHVDSSDPITGETWTRGWLADLDPGQRDLLLPRGAWDETNLVVDIQDPLRYGIALELHDFATAVATGRTPEVGADAGTRSVAICLAILESAHLGGAPVAIADVLDGRVRDWQSDLDEELGLG
jgi:predicted dehydrogenase